MAGRPGSAAEAADHLHGDLLPEDLAHQLGAAAHQIQLDGAFLGGTQRELQAAFLAGLEADGAHDLAMALVHALGQQQEEREQADLLAGLQAQPGVQVGQGLVQQKQSGLWALWREKEMKMPMSCSRAA